MYRALSPWYVELDTSSDDLRKAYVPTRSPSRSTDVSNCRHSARVSTLSPSRSRNRPYPSSIFSHSANAASQAASDGNRLSRSQVFSAETSPRVGTRSADTADSSGAFDQCYGRGGRSEPPCPRRGNG